MEFKRFTKKNLLINSLLVVLYLLWNKVIGGIRSEHYFLVAIWIVSFYAYEKSRKFITAYSIFIIYWIIYDSMRIIPNYQVSTVHIRAPYELEKSLFGIFSDGQLLTPNEYLSLNSSYLFDLLSGLFYINWVPIPLAFGVYLYLKNKYLFTQFAMVFLLVNIIGFIIYYIYPAAPPWYVELYGFDLKIGVPGNSAGLARFDEIIGLPLFAGIYNKNANVLAAIPSLHSAYPVIVLFYSIKMKLGWIKWFFGIFMIGIWCSAVYSSHHYIIDVALGAIIALITLIIFNKIIQKPVIDKYLKKFISYI